MSLFPLAPPTTNPSVSAVGSSIRNLVRIPYSLVPHLDLSSRAYFRALSLLSKQQLVDSVPTSCADPQHAHSLALCAKHTSEVLAAQETLGTFLIFFIFTLSDLLFLVHTNIVTEADREVIKRTRDMVCHAIVSQFIDEDSASHEAFQNSIRHQIVVASQQLRVHLVLVDRLLDIYHQSATASKGKGRA